MKTYLVTGAAGFIGARFVGSLKDKGISVISVDRTDYFKERAEHLGIDFGTIIDRDLLFRELESSSNRLPVTGPVRVPVPVIDAVIHMGACSNTTETDIDYLQRINVEYSQKLWNYCTLKKIPFIYASSAATYGEGEQGYEDNESTISKLQPLNPYGNSKQIFDVWALAQEKSGNHPPVWSGFKFFNVYGFGERHKGSQASVILHAYDQIQKTQGMKLFRSHREGIAHGEQKRDFIAVEDVIEVLHFAAEKPIRRGIFNLGTGRAQSFRELALAVFSAMGKPDYIEFIDTPVAIRDKYQYFTEAKMDRLRSEGYARPFADLRTGASAYVKRLLGA
jgi:ADP-L-glycero-D-manno-heptose 6-epimerase